MLYKGADLDMRSNQGSASQGVSADDGGHNGGRWLTAKARGGPIYVDGTVLACCNHAHDVAFAHGAREVRLEHLIYAMTRMAPAAELLEHRGVRTNQLRRETAIAVASEVPVETDAAPRSSVDLERVLRRAADRAATRGTASVEDVLWALLGCGRDVPAVALLLAAAPDLHELERWHGQSAAELQAPSGSGVGRLEHLDAAMRPLRAEIAAGGAVTANLIRELRNEVAGKLQELGQTLSRDEHLPVVSKLLSHQSGIGARLEAVEGRMTTHPAEITSAISKTLVERFEDGQVGLQLMQEQAALRWGAIEERLLGLEAIVETLVQKSSDAAEGSERGIGKISDTLVKLGSKQQNLAASFESWRLENSGDVGIVANRLEHMEPMLLEKLSHLVDEVQSLRLEVEGKRRRFGGARQWFASTGRAVAGTLRRQTLPYRARLGHLRLKRKT